MEEIKIRNETIINLNVASNAISKILRNLNYLYYKDFPDIVETYRQKIFEYENIFKGNNMTFFTNNILGQIILNHFDNTLTKAADLVSEIVNNISNLPENYVLKKIILILNLKNIKEYEKLCNLLESFSLEKDLKDCANNFFESRKFYLYKPGWFEQNYYSLKEILVKLKIDLEGLDESVLPTIEMQESQITFIRGYAKMQAGSESEEVIQEYINNMVEDVKKEVKGKRKKHV